MCLTSSSPNVRRLPLPGVFPGVRPLRILLGARETVLGTSGDGVTLGITPPLRGTSSAMALDDASESYSTSSSSQTKSSSAEHASSSSSSSSSFSSSKPRADPRECFFPRRLDHSLALGPAPRGGDDVRGGSLLGNLGRRRAAAYLDDFERGRETPSAASRPPPGARRWTALRTPRQSSPRRRQSSGRASPPRAPRAPPAPSCSRRSSAGSISCRWLGAAR